MTEEDEEDDLDFASLVDPSLARAMEDEYAEHMRSEEEKHLAAIGRWGTPRVMHANPPEPGSLMQRTFYPERTRPFFEPMQITSAPTEHASYLGASDIGAILGLDPMRTALDVWVEKRGLVLFEATPETEAGHDHEAAVVAGFARRMRRAGIVERVDHPGPGTIRMLGVMGGWRGATLDAVAHHVDHGPVSLEAKLVGAGQASAWGPEPAGADAIPERTLVQVHWQTHHVRERFGWKAPIAYVAADIMGTDRRVYEIVIDDDLIAELLKAGRAWWERHVIGGEMPEPTARDVHTLGRVFPHATRPLSPIVPFVVRELAEEYDVMREIATRHRAEMERISALLRAALGDCEGYRWDGGKVTWREDPTTGGRRLNVRIRRPSDG